MADEREVEPTVTGWLNTIASYERDFKKWEGRVDRILKRYRDDNRPANTTNPSSKFNILWSNVQTSIPAVFSRLPKPDVSRRFKDNDPVGRVAALILERALEYEIEHYANYRSAMVNCVQDRFLGGRGLAWIRYEPHFKAAPEQPDDGFQVTEDIDEPDEEGQEPQEPQEVLDYECAPVDYVHWRDFGHTVARTWEEVTAVWRKVYMGRDALIERFGDELGNKIPLDTKPDSLKKDSADENYEACIYEIWDKEEGKAYWLSKSMPDMLDEKDDPLELDEFWPCPKPLFATMTTDSLVPVPDYTLYQDQAVALDTLCDRIDGLIKALQVKGVYDAAVPELKRLLTEGENNTLIPVTNWMAFSEKNGLKGAIDLIDLMPIFKALEVSYTAMEQQKKQIYEITGLSDIIRAQTDPNETATAQKMKGQFGSMRLRTMQNEVARFATDILKIKAQIICKQFDPQTLCQIGDVMSLSDDDKQFIMPAIQLLKSGTSSLRIDVEADSLVQIDELQEKQDRVEFLKATGAFLKEASAAGIQTPEIIPLLVEMLKFGVTGFKIGKTIEGTFDTFSEKAKQAAMQPKQPQPDPEMMKIQAGAQADQQAMQMKAQLDKQHLQFEMQAEQGKQQAQHQQVLAQNQIEAQRAQLESQQNAQIEQMKQQHEANLEAQRLEFERWKAELDANTKVVVAEISAKTSLDTAAITATSKDETTNYSADGTKSTKSGLSALVESMNSNMEKLMQAQTDNSTQLMTILTKPKKVIRGSDGRVVGVQ